jgi:hypothetical protein
MLIEGLDMNYDIDLKELARRESETVEWKENGDDEPVFELGAENVTCILPAHPHHRIKRR